MDFKVEHESVIHQKLFQSETQKLHVFGRKGQGQGSLGDKLQKSEEQNPLTHTELHMLEVEAHMNI